MVYFTVSLLAAVLNNANGARTLLLIRPEMNIGQVLTLY